MEKVRVCICIAASRGPRALHSLLESLSHLAFDKRPAPDLRLVVVENNRDGGSQHIVEKFRSIIPWKVDYEIEANRGIPFVRNRLVDLSGDADFIAFIDDDEIAEPQWIDELLFVQQQTRADVVLGPVVSVFERRPSIWLARAFEPVRHKTCSEADLSDFRTSNILIKAESLAGLEPPFCEDFSRSGGSDTHLGKRLLDAGRSFYWADEAVVEEHVPESRISMAWILQRNFRIGNALAHILFNGLSFKGKMQSLVAGFQTRLIHAFRARSSRGPSGPIWLICQMAAGLGAFGALINLRYYEYRHLSPKPEGLQNGRLD